jgi:XisI protein
MDPRATYRPIIERALTEYAAVPYAHGDVRTVPVFDHEHDRYLLVNVGRDGLRRVHGCLVHIDIEGDDILVQRDGTEHGIARELAAAGVAPERIVLAFHPNGPFRLSEADAA